MSQLLQTVDEPMVCCVPESHFLEILAGHGPCPTTVLILQQENYVALGCHPAADC
jgi:hypothetical protein